MKLKSIKKCKNLKGKTILLRVDFNVPIEKNKIKEDYKIDAGLRTIKFLEDSGVKKIIIISHLGEPDPKAKLADLEKKYSLKIVSSHLAKLTSEKITFVKGLIDDKTKTLINKSKDKFILLENLRFNEGEKNNDKKFAKILGNLADIYINDAFAVSHREHTSVVAIRKTIPSYSGLLIEEEIKNADKALKPKKPLIVIVGGAKIKTKVNLIKNLSKKADYVLVGGAIANNFLASRKIEIGKSMIESESIKLAKKLDSKKIIIPIDVIVGKKYDDQKPIVKPINKILKSDIILDIGPETMKLFSTYIKHAKTLVWNGPMGYFENPKFKQGTFFIARAVAMKSSGKAFGLVGGGETVEALKATKMFDYVDWVSSGGGASLAYLGNEKMPGL